MSGFVCNEKVALSCRTCRCTHTHTLHIHMHSLLLNLHEETYTAHICGLGRPNPLSLSLSLSLSCMHAHTHTHTHTTLPPSLSPQTLHFFFCAEKPRTLKPSYTHTHTHTHTHLITSHSTLTISPPKLLPVLIAWRSIGRANTSRRCRGRR